MQSWPDSVSEGTDAHANGTTAPVYANDRNVIEIRRKLLGEHELRDCWRGGQVWERRKTPCV